jgi:SAM-dependent methyltransferase
MSFKECLVCPECQGALDIYVDEQQGDAIRTGGLVCECGASYPIQEFVPRFVRSDGYVDTFSFQWRKHRLTQLDADTRRESEETFRLSTGLEAADLAGKVVLDVGCGMGRFSDVVSRAGAEVVGIDLSYAIDAAHDNLAGRANVNLAQADVFKLPFRTGTFDCIFSIGVLHHTPDARAAVLHLIPYLKPGGVLAIWVYPRYKFDLMIRHAPDRFSRDNGPYVLRAPIRLGRVGLAVFSRVAIWLDRATNLGNSLARAVGRRLPVRVLYALCHVAIPLYHVLKLRPFAPLRLFIKISMHPDPEWRVLDTFDNLSPKYQSRHTYEEVQGWFEEGGLEDLSCQPNFVGVRGRRPAAHPGQG